MVVQLAVRNACPRGKPRRGSRRGNAHDIGEIAGLVELYRILFASCVRDVTSNLRNALRRWYSTVLGLMKR